MRKKAENVKKKCGIEFWELEKSPVCPDNGQGSPKPRQNTAEKIGHQLCPFS
jgi:hypothetical protein